MRLGKHDVWRKTGSHSCSIHISTFYAALTECVCSTTHQLSNNTTEMSQEFHEVIF
jgi:hypothetical protein